jgi:hypothetical protein
MVLRLRRVVRGFAALSVVCGVRAAWSESKSTREHGKQQTRPAAGTNTDNARSADNRQRGEAADNAPEAQYMRRFAVPVRIPFGYHA